jgi:crotonobetainyl-CoA:carnitine CoA-transferase CaiB-like acyl-CoA transferase
MLPLKNVRVLTVEQYGAGPFGTMFLADQGAEVIKIENPSDGGDMSRDVALDLSKPVGKEVLHDLIKTADALASNLRGDVPEKLGLTYAHLKAHNERIVCAHLSAYGRDNERTSWPGFDYLMQAEAGYFSLTGEPGGPPARFGLSVVDLMTGLGLAYALLAALTGARATGKGRDIDVSLFDMALHNVNYPAAWYLNEGHVVDRIARSAHPSLTPCQLYTTADGWIFIMCNKEKFWPVLCGAIARPEWAEDPRFARFADRLENRDLVTELLDEVLKEKTTAEWMQNFAGKVPASPINDVAQALDNPFVTENDRLQTLNHPTAGEFRLVAPPVRSDEPPPARPAPRLGEHTEEILNGLGYSEARIGALRSAGVI